MKYEVYIHLLIDPLAVRGVGHYATVRVKLILLSITFNLITLQNYFTISFNNSLQRWLRPSLKHLHFYETMKKKR